MDHLLCMHEIEALADTCSVFRGGRHIQTFRDTIPRYMMRHKIKAGITGWAQVNGLRGNTSISERIKYDLYYLENWSLAFDFKILVKTCFARENAY